MHEDVSSGPVPLFVKSLASQELTSIVRLERSSSDFVHAMRRVLGASLQLFRRVLQLRGLKCSLVRIGDVFWVCLLAKGLEFRRQVLARWLYYCPHNGFRIGLAVLGLGSGCAGDAKHGLVM